VTRSADAALDGFAMNALAPIVDQRALGGDAQCAPSDRNVATLPDGEDMLNRLDELGSAVLARIAENSASGGGAGLMPTMKRRSTVDRSSATSLPRARRWFGMFTVPLPS